MSGGLDPLGRVLVVGAGLAGLTAGLRLSSRGVPVTVVEQADRVGGRLAPARLAGMHYAPFPDLVPAWAPALAGLITDLGAGEEACVEPLAKLRLWRRGRLHSLDLHGASRPGRAPGVPPWQTLRLRHLSRRLEAPGARRDGARGDRLRFDDRSVADLARLYLGRQMLERLLRPVFTCGLGLEPEATSRLLLLELLDSDGGVRLARARGVGALPDRIAKRLRDVRAGARVSALLPEGRGVLLEDGETLRAAAVILAIPAPQARTLLEPLSPLEAILLGRAAYAQRVVLALLTRPRVEIPGDAVWVPPDAGGLLAALLPEARSTTEGVLLLIGRPDLARVHGPDDERGAITSLMRGAEFVLPQLRERVVASRLHRFTAGVAGFDVGRYREAERLRRETASGRRVVLCGDYLSGPHLEGAVAAGDHAAEEAFRLLRDA